MIIIIIINLLHTHIWLSQVYGDFKHTCTNYKGIHAVVDLGVCLALVMDGIDTKVFDTSVPSLDFVVLNPEAI